MTRNSINRSLTIFIGVVCLATISIEMINGRFWLTDFRVYYSAARNFFSGQPVYHVCYDGGAGYFKYSPVVLFFFLPYTIFSYKVACILHFTVLGVAFWGTFTLLLNFMKRYFFGGRIRKEGLLIILSFIPILIFFTREMHLGNINILMLLFCCLALWFYLEQKPITGSVFFALVLFAKPFYLFLLIPLLWRRKWRELGYLALVLCLGLAAPFLIHGFRFTADLYSGWLSTMLSHDSGFPGMNALDYIIRHNLLPGMPSRAEYMIILGFAGLISGFVVNNIRREKTTTRPEQIQNNFAFEWFLCLSLLPVLFKNDWVQMLLTAPLISFIIFFIAAEKKKLVIPVFVVLAFFFSANSDDLLGRDFSAWILRSGVMGLANFCLIILAYGCFLSFRANSCLPGASRDLNK